MGNLLGKSGGKTSETDKALLQLKIQRDKLKQYQKQLQNRHDRETEVARECMKRGDKRRAVLALKKRKYQIQLLEKTDTQLLNIEELTQNIEYKLVEQKVLDGLKQGTDILQKLNQAMKLEDVDKIMDDTQDAIEYQRQVENALSGSLSAEDEDAIAAELDALEKETIGEVKDEKPRQDTEVKLPDVPKHEPEVTDTGPVKQPTQTKQAIAAE